ncbi:MULTISPECIES: hypothetical protein [unclassified Microcoleus]|nr:MULTISPECIES: hypothetical protein [unclassified Microcoleus]
MPVRSRLSVPTLTGNSATRFLIRFETVDREQYFSNLKSQI